MKKSLIPFVLALGVSVLFTGCTKDQALNTQATNSVMYKNEQFVVPQKPERVAVLATSILNMIYAIDGKAIARTETKEPLDPEAKALPTVGHTTNINTEALLALKPDLVFGLAHQHQKLIPIFDSNKIPHVITSYNGIQDNLPLLDFLGKVLHKEDKTKEISAIYKSNYQKAVNAGKSVPPARVAVLRATGKSVTAETESAITASMVKELSMNNVLLEHKNIKADATTVPYSLERISEDNPDIIFIVTMGDLDEVQKTLTQEMTGNPAWSQLKAVKENKVFYLPQNLFLLNPGLQTPDAMSMLLDLAYGIKLDFNKK